MYQLIERLTIVSLFLLTGFFRFSFEEKTSENLENENKKNHKDVCSQFSFRR